MLLTACCIGAATFTAMGIVLSKALGRWHVYLWLPLLMFIVGFTFTGIIVFAPGFLFSVLVYTSNLSQSGVELRLVIAMGLVQVRVCDVTSRLLAIMETGWGAAVIVVVVVVVVVVVLAVAPRRKRRPIADTCLCCCR